MEAAAQPRDIYLVSRFEQTSWEMLGGLSTEPSVAGAHLETGGKPDAAGETIR